MEAHSLLKAIEGYGPLLQRDYWTVVRDCSLNPPDLVALVMARFEEFAPDEICLFRRTAECGPTLRVGDVLDIQIKMAPKCRVTVLHRDRNSFTLGTLQGHPEAGRITFGAYRNERGDVVFHIRSRARSSSARHYAGFLAVGEAMQTQTWTEFVNRVALTAGTGPLRGIHADTRPMSEDEETAVDHLRPTFVAQGD